ncbi:MAG: hypothetical protein H0W64_00595 [Gammaproteobacteria bacterium]|nr:hypothetical protein [Gammaproteobacteria bacterium]
MNKIEVRRASFDDAENIVSLLEGFYPGVPNHWRKIFTPRAWDIEENFPGYVIVDQKKIVGFLGTIFSDHQTEKGQMRLCNLTTWYVEPPYRQHGLMLFLKVMKIPNVSWTNLTAAPHTYEWLQRSGFKTLENKQTVVLPLPQFSPTQVTITTQIEETNLPISLHPIYDKHRNLNCKHILIKKQDQLCYCLAVITRYKKLPVAKIYYFSDSQFFSEVLNEIRFKLCHKLRVSHLVLEGDLLQGHRMIGAWIKETSPPRLYKSDKFGKEDMTLLCSELFILGI